MMLMMVLFLSGLFAGAIDAIAGGGGLITLPVLLGVGLPPHVAFGTNKLQGVFGTMMATRRYYRGGWISFKSLYVGIISGALGAIAGAIANQLISGAVLRQVVPVLLGIIFTYIVMSPKLGSEDGQARMNNSLFYAVFGFALAFYDGFFGPGVGAFWVFLIMFFLGHNLIKATAYTKLLNLNSSMIALGCFALGANIDYKVGACMAAGQLVGGQLGASLAIRKGARLIRPLFLIMVFGTIASLTYRNYGGIFKRMPLFAAQCSLYILSAMMLLLAGVLIYRFWQYRTITL